MLYYQAHNISENTRSGRSLYGDPLKLNPNGQDGDTKWVVADDLVRLAGLTEDGEIDQTYIEILGTANIGNAISGAEVDVSYESIEPIIEQVINCAGDLNSIMTDFPVNYEIVAVTTTDANYNAVTFSQPVLYADIAVRGRANVGRFRKASADGDYIEIGIGEIRRVFPQYLEETIGYVARDAATNITFECIGYYYGT